MPAIIDSITLPRRDQTESEPEPEEFWGVLEVMGHRTIYGLIREEQHFGKIMVRIDVPAADKDWQATQLYSPDSVYAITPTTEAFVREMTNSSQRSMTLLEGPSRPSTTRDDDHFDDYDDDGDWPR